MELTVAIAIDIGGTNTVFGFVDQKGQSHFVDSVLTNDFPKADLLVEAISLKLMTLLDVNSKIQPIGIGIGAPNGNYFSGTIEFAPNLKWEGSIDLVELFEEHFDLPIFVTNDANAAAIGEMLFGKTKGILDFLMITLGTGLGSGFVSNGEVIYGHDGMAGELGHIVIEPNGRPCKCGQKGCLESYASATGIVKTAHEFLIEKEMESILNLESMSSKAIGEAALKGDQLAQDCFNYTAEMLARGLATAVAIASPKMIVLFGGLTNAGPLLLEPLKTKLEEKLIPVFRNKVEIQISGLLDENAAIIGAGALVWNHLRDKWYELN